MQRATVHACHAIARTAALNLAFLALCAAGLGILGVAPAAAALLHASARVAASGGAPHALPLLDLLAGMAREWRAEFVRANLAAGPPLALAAGLLALGARGPGRVPAASASEASLAALTPLAPFAALACCTFAGATLVGIARRAGGVRDALANGARLCALAPGRLLLLDGAWLVLGAAAALQHALMLFGIFALHAALAVRVLDAPLAGRAPA